MTLKFVQRAEANEISMSIFLGNATFSPSVLTTLVSALVLGALLIAYVGYFSILRFRRYKTEKAEHEKVNEVYD